MDAATARNGTAFRFDIVMRPREERGGIRYTAGKSEQRPSQIRETPQVLSMPSC